MLPGEEQKLREYVSTKLPKFEKLVTRFSEDSVSLQIKAEKFNKHQAYEVEMILKLPSITLIGREASHMITKAVDLSKDRLENELRKFEDRLKRKHRGIKMKMKKKVMSEVIMRAL